MKLRSFDNPSEYRTHVLPLLLRAEAENCVPIGVIDRVAAGRAGVPGEAASRPLLLSFDDDDGQPVSMAMQTPPAGLLVHRSSPDAIDLLAAWLADAGWAGEMVGPAETIDALAERFAARTGRTGSIDLRLWLLRCDRLNAPAMLDAEGFLRPCTADDLDLAAAWCKAFAEDIGDPSRDARALAETVIAERRLHYWIDRDLGQPRSMVAWAGPTPRGVRVNHVYTPPEHRRRGHATRATAALTRQLLSGGRDFCTLFTDQKNPTSNGIYESIGYRRVCAFHNWNFETGRDGRVPGHAPALRP